MFIRNSYKFSYLKVYKNCVTRYNNEPIMQKAVLLLFTGNSKQQRRITLEE